MGIKDFMAFCDIYLLFVLGFSCMGLFFDIVFLNKIEPEKEVLFYL